MGNDEVVKFTYPTGGSGVIEFTSQIEFTSSETDSILPLCPKIQKGYSAKNLT